MPRCGGVGRQTNKQINKLTDINRENLLKKEKRKRMVNGTSLVRERENRVNGNKRKKEGKKDIYEGPVGQCLQPDYCEYGIWVKTVVGQETGLSTTLYN